MSSALGQNLPSAAVAVVGVLVGWAWFQGAVWALVAATLLALSIAFGWLSRERGRGHLQGGKRDPVRAVPLLERSAVYEAAIGALVAATLIVLAVYVAKGTGTGTDEETKQLITAGAGALTALLTAVFVKNVEDFDALVADPVRDAFQSAYEGCFASGSTEWRAIYDPNFGGMEGWSDREARRTRARAVAGKPCRPR